MTKVELVKRFKRRPRRGVLVAAMVAAFTACLAVAAALMAGLPVAAVTEARPGTSVVVDAHGPSPTTSSAPSTASAPGTTGAPTSAAVTSIHDVDLRNFGYPSSLCPAVAATNGTVTLVDGVGGVDWRDYQDNTATMGHGIEIEVTPTYGDVTGDGVDDAIVRLECYYVPGDAGDTNLAVVSMTPTGPAVIGTLGDAGVTHSVVNDIGSYDVTYGNAQAVRAEDGQLVVDWLDGQMGSRYSTTVHYRLQGNGFTAVSDNGAQDTWPTPTGPPGRRTTEPVGSSIHRHEPDAINVPLSDGRTCGPQFADLGPLADAPLDPGRTSFDGVSNIHYADVFTADGRPTNAQVTVSGATYKELTGIDGAREVEMVADVGCTRGDVTTYGLLVLRDAAAGPEAIGWSFGPSPFEGTTNAGVSQIDLDDGDLVVEWHDEIGVVQAAQRFRWDGAAFVEVDMGCSCYR